MNPIVGIGEILWDVYPDGRKVAGGAPFNFAFHCHQLGHPAAVVSRVGDDDLGRELRERVRELGLTDEFIQTDREHPTGTVRVTLDDHKVPTYTITEDVAWDHIEWEERLFRLATRTRAVCFGTLSARSPTSGEAVGNFIDTVHGSTGPALIVFDINLRQADVDYGLVTLGGPVVDWIKLNSQELDRIARLHWPVPFVSKTVTQRLAAPSQVLMITRGPEGCDFHIGGEVVHEPGVPAAVVDTVGAGDAFTAAMVCLHLEGRPLRECARFAVHYAARVCEHAGGTPRIDRREVEAAAGVAP
jgi:fructokinase